MREPADSESEPPIEAVIEVSHSTIEVYQTDASDGAQSLADGETLMADEPLNRLERIAANLGAWVVTVAERWHIQSGPAFVVDGRPIGDLLDPVQSPTEDDPGAPTP